MSPIRLFSIGWLCTLVLLATTTLAEDKITFEEHIKPIFREHCLTCHSQTEKKSDLALDTFASTLAGGSGGEIVVASDLESSRLWELVSHVAEPFMPPKQDKLSDAKLDLIKRWIEQGMPENAGSIIKRKNNAASAMLTGVSLGKPDGPPPMPVSVLKQPAVFTQRSAAISALAASPWASLVAISGQRQVSLYQTQTGELLGVIPFPEGEPQSLNFTRDGRQLLIGGGRHGHSGCAVLVDVATGDRLAKVGDELDIVLTADISPDKRRIALGGPQKVVRIFDTASGELVTEMKKHTDWIFAIRYSPDGVLLASADRSNGMVVWEADTGRLYADLVGHKGEILGLDFRADSNVLASTAADGTVKLWDMIEGKLSKSWDAHGGGGTSAKFTHDGVLATSGRDARVKSWDGTGKLLAEFTGLTEAALEVSITGDGSQIIGGDWNGRVQLWQTQDATQTMTLAANPPTLAQALEVARAALTAVQSEFDAAKQAAETSSAQLAQSQGLLAATDEKAKAQASQLETATKSQFALSEALAQQDKTIAELEAKLAEARNLRAETASAKAKVDVDLVQFAMTAESAKQELAAVKTKHDELTAQAQQATAKQQEFNAKLSAATQSVQRAEADKAAFDGQAEKLKATSDSLVEQANQLQTQLAALAAQEQTQQATAQKVTEQIAALQTQLNELTKQLANVAAAQTAANSELSASQSKAAETKLQFEKAQQEVLDAQERLKLFSESYK